MIEKIDFLISPAYAVPPMMTVFSSKEIIESVDKGIYAVNFGGGQVDITSGDFVFSSSEMLAASPSKKYKFLYVIS